MYVCLCLAKQTTCSSKLDSDTALALRREKQMVDRCGYDHKRRWQDRGAEDAVAGAPHDGLALPPKLINFMPDSMHPVFPETSVAYHEVRMPQYDLRLKQVIAHMVAADVLHEVLEFAALLVSELLPENIRMARREKLITQKDERLLRKLNELGKDAKHNIR